MILWRKLPAKNRLEALKGEGLNILLSIDLFVFMPFYFNSLKLGPQYSDLSREFRGACDG